MPGSQLHVHLYRDSFNTPWGFRLQGGKDLNQPLTVQRVFSNSPAEGELQRGDVILAIGGEATVQLSHKGAQDAIKNAGGQINLVVNRPPPGCVHISPISPPIVTQRPRAPSLQDLSPSSPSPRRPNNIQYNQNPSANYGQQHKNPATSNQNHHNMTRHGKHHNQPIHVHIEPSRPTSQTTYYLHTPSPQPHQQPKGYFHSNDPYGTMPRRQRGYSQPPYQSPTTPTIPPPPWATQQASPKKVSKLSKLGGGEASFGTSFRSSTLPRHASYQNMAQHHATRPQHQQEDEADAPDLFAEKRPTGPPPKVCSLGKLGGGGINFATGSNESQTLPRRNIQRRLSQPPSMPSRSPYGIYQGSNTPAQRFEPGAQNGVMLNRVQSSLDNITLSPRTPDSTQRTPFYQAPGQERQFYTPTSLLLEQQKMEEQELKRKQQQQQQQQQQLLQQQQQQQQRQYQPQPQPQPQNQPQPQRYQYQQPPPPPQQQQQQYGGQDEVDEGEEPIVPVWERRRQFQEVAPAPGVRTPRTNPVPKVSRPAPGKTSYSDFGLSYRPQNKTSTTTWQPVPAPKPAHAPPPQVVHYSSTPAAHAAPQSPVKSAPPPWPRSQENDDGTDGTPAWRNTLRSTGVKPWDVDLNYQPDQEPQRSVSFNPTPYQTLYAPQMGGDATDASEGGPKVVHLQYNSPMGLYSKENVEETYRGQASGLSGQQQSPQPQANQTQGQGQGLPGGRDWSQSQVFQFIQQDKTKKPKGKLGPATAPKPHAALRQFDQQPQQQQQQQRQQQHHYQPPPQQHHQQPYHDEVGISDF